MWADSRGLYFFEFKNKPARKNKTHDDPSRTGVSQTFFCFPSLTVPKAQAPNSRQRRDMTTVNAGVLLWIVSCFVFFSNSIAQEPQLGSARVVFQTNYGDIEFGFYPSVAPKTVDHIFKLVRLGGYNTNHFFRVDKGFVAQVADVAGGRTAPMNEEQRVEAEKKVVAEFSEVKHVRGILSMGR